MSNPRVVFPAIALAVGLAGVTSAQAQNLNPPPPPPGPRVGWEVGFGLYGGEINCENENGDFCDGVTEAGGIDLHVNYFFRPHLGAYFDVFPMVHSENNWTFTHNVVTAGVKWRPVPILTLTAGLGSAQARLRYETLGLQAQSDVVGAALFAAGLEVVRGRWATTPGARRSPLHAEERTATATPTSWVGTSASARR
jgi:hypothetical protein